jgi:hypothetical protein
MDFYFLLFSLFFPRLTLIVTSLFVPAAYPQNSVPLLADLLLGFLFPRILILIYIYQNFGYDNIWFIAHLVAAVIAYSSGSWETRRRRRRRRDR